jgi:hypothetical protein
MVFGLRAFLEGIIDYAGLFPPAGLPLEQAVRNYLRYRQEPESWMLAGFVCPVARLAELTPLLPEVFPERERLVLSVLGRGGERFRDFAANLMADLQDVKRFQERPGRRADIAGFETRLPPGVPSDFLKRVDADWESGFLPPPVRYYESSPGLSGQDSRAASLTAIAPTTAGWKLRCGGLEAKAFPTVEQVAAVIVACRDAHVRLKFTAGLHHPIRRFDPGIGVKMHGFVNVFGAAVLAHARGLDADQVRQILEDEDPGNLVFDDTGFRWKDHRAATAEIVAARRWVVSFGSCSFEEPRDDLRVLGWLP